MVPSPPVPHSPQVDNTELIVCKHTNTPTLKVDQLLLLGYLSSAKVLLRGYVCPLATQYIPVSISVVSSAAISKFPGYASPMSMG